ncbi:hypothetical protein BpHYR1_034410 [Brachionus plicatilis]|uniref:Uncharacterized protein n=1 Tax=Brachionus plicatilis TaxID=10195 RepID=A0A3M7QUF6_BRAPC|nr:hypothetical protein BpHYR1_034410 [Brachionus plicatilis]
MQPVRLALLFHLLDILSDEFYSKTDFFCWLSSKFTKNYRHPITFLYSSKTFKYLFKNSPEIALEKSSDIKCKQFAKIHILYD